jgi:hypothetical protein
MDSAIEIALNNYDHGKTRNAFKLLSQDATLVVVRVEQLTRRLSHC